MTIFARLSLHTVSEANSRGHWSKGAGRAKRQRWIVAVALHGHTPAPLPLVVTLTRGAPSSGLDGDNLQRALKAVRDGVADFLGVDDGDERIAWRYEQKRERRGHYSVAIEIEAAPCG